eukprot:3542703-Pyramimonas_sp.AAC.1
MFTLIIYRDSRCSRFGNGSLATWRSPTWRPIGSRSYSWGTSISTLLCPCIRAPEIDRRRPVSDVAPHVAGAVWKRIFALLLEVDYEMPTRYVAQEGQQPKLTQIDRVFLSSQSWEAIRWTASVSTPDLPEFLFEKGIGDHSPVVLSLAPRPAAHPDTQRISSFIVQDPDYARFIKNMASEVDWQSLTAASKRRATKHIMKESARMVRSRLVRNPESTEARLM